MKIIYISICLTVIVATGNGFGVDISIPGTKITVGTDGIQLSPTSDAITFGREECTACTKYINDRVDLYRNAVRQTNLSMVLSNKIPQCGDCIAKYVDAFDIYGDACVTPVPNYPNQTDTKTNLRWNYTVVSCICRFTDQADLLNALTQVQNVATECLNNNTNIDATAVTDSTAFIASQQAIATLQSCLTTSGQNINGNETLNVTGVWQNPIFSLTIRKNYNVKGPKSATFATGGVLKRNLTDINITCESDALVSSTTCNCLVDSRLVPSLMDLFGEVVVKCHFNKNTPTQQLVYDSYLVCPN